jgi:hypothetical protein
MAQSYSVSVTRRREASVKRPAGQEARADDGVRTRDPQLGKLMLYQLSYVRVRFNDSVIGTG